MLADEIKWVYDIDDAKKIAKKENKIIMVDVYTDWCGWCKRLDQTTYKHNKVVALSKKIINVKINPEKSKRSKKFARDHKVSGYPAIIFIDAQGNELHSQPGYIDGPQFAKMMKQVIEIQNLDTYMQEFKEENYSHSSTLLKLLLMKSEIDKAKEVLTKLEKIKHLSTDEKASAYIEMGLYYGKKDKYPVALVYFERVDKEYKSSPRYFEGVYYYTYMLHLNGDIKEALSRLEKVMNNKKLPAQWKNYFKQLKKKIK